MKKITAKSRAIDRSSTGIAGLDDILQGGLPSGHFYLIQGDPGVGKTTLGLQFLLAGTRIGERGLYVTLSESRKELLAVAESHNWSLDAVSVIDISFIKRHMKNAETGTLTASDIEGITVVKALLDECDKTRPLRVVFDSISELRLICGDALAYRQQMLKIKDVFAQKGATTLFVQDKAEAIPELHLEGIAHGIVEMEKSHSDFGAEQRRLKIGKLRGSEFRAGYHNYVIQEGGLRVFPRLIAAEHQKSFSRKPLSSERDELDALLGGGLDRGTSTLFSGPTGTGKSTLAMHFAVAAAKKGEKSLIYSFEENIDTTVNRCRNIGMELDPLLESSKIVLRQVNPGELSPGEFAHDIKNSVLEDGVSLIVIDSLNGYLNAMPDEKFLHIQLHELLMFLSQQGVITIMTVAQHGAVELHAGPVDVSYLADTVVLLRYFEALGSVRKAISVVKKRSGAHETTIRQFQIQSAKGVQIGDPIKEFQGVLTGTPDYVGTGEEMNRQSGKLKRRLRAGTKS